MYEAYSTIKVVIADDHEIYRDGFRSLLQNNDEIELVAEAGNGVSLLEITKMNNPDVVLTDIKMPVMDGIEATRKLNEEFPHIPIIALTMFDEDHYIFDMLSAGARGYVLKDAHKSEILNAIKTVNKNQSYFCKATHLKIGRLIANKLFDPKNNKIMMPLSDREKQILRLVCAQKSNKEISKVLKISVRTVEGFRTILLEKTQSQNMAGLVVFAMRYGIYVPQ